jgi:hypothetical protein
MIGVLSPKDERMHWLKSALADAQACARHIKEAIAREKGEGYPADINANLVNADGYAMNVRSYIGAITRPVDV